VVARGKPPQGKVRAMHHHFPQPAYF
jgi:hypothetical protein